MQKKFCGSVSITFLDRERAIEEIQECARKLQEKDNNIAAIALFGSLARAEATPSSDADILVILKQHFQKRWFDRIPEYSDMFSNTSLPTEVFPYTIREIHKMMKQTGFIQTVIKEAIPLIDNQNMIRELKTQC